MIWAAVSNCSGLEMRDVPVNEERRLRRRPIDRPPGHGGGGIWVGGLLGSRYRCRDLGRSDPPGPLASSISVERGATTHSPQPAPARHAFQQAAAIHAVAPMTQPLPRFRLDLIRHVNFSGMGDFGNPKTGLARGYSACADMFFAARARVVDQCNSLSTRGIKRDHIENVNCSEDSVRMPAGINAAAYISSA